MGVIVVWGKGCFCGFALLQQTGDEAVGGRVGRVAKLDRFLERVVVAIVRDDRLDRLDLARTCHELADRLERLWPAGHGASGVIEKRKGLVAGKEVRCEGEGRPRDKLGKELHAEVKYVAWRNDEVSVRCMRFACRSAPRG